jgi:hypothetical protein
MRIHEVATLQVAFGQNLSKKNCGKIQERKHPGSTISSMNRREFAVLLPAMSLALGCDSEPKPVVTATLPNNEKIQNAIEHLGSVIGDLEEGVDGLQHGDWRKFVPKVETTAGDIRIAYEHLRQALGMPTG